MTNNTTTMDLRVGKDRLTIVDIYTFDRLKLGQLRLTAQVHKRGKVYAQYHDGVSNRSLHRLIAGAQKGQIVDHINGDGLDNRDCNLRLCTVGQNRANSVKTRKCVSGLKGVARNGTMWTANISHAGLRYYLGSFRSKRRAGLAVDRAAKALHGEFAGLNFPDVPTRAVMPTGGYRLGCRSQKRPEAPPVAT